jgi:hypothetical protein
MQPHPPSPAYEDFETALHDAAREATGLSDFGDEAYREGLRRVIEAYASDLPDDAETRRTCFTLTLPGLVGRLHSELGWRETPECLEEPIVQPLVIAGIPRTGTTALHSLLAMDPQFQGLQNWIIPNPIVRPPRERWADHPLHRAAVERVAALAAASPKAMRVHTVEADDVDECLALMMQSFVTNQLPSLLDLPSYDAWYLEQDEATSYRRLADNLRLIGHAEREKIWLLKNPTHLLRMQTLLEVLPDARIIHTHREPVATFGSMCSMLAAFRGNPEPGSPAALAIGPRQLRLYKIATEHTMAVRKGRPEAFHDVHQSELATDPMGVVHGIYRRFDLELGPEAEHRMQQWIAAHPVNARGEHRYRPEDYGLSDEAIRRELELYTRRYGL